FWANKQDHLARTAFRRAIPCFACVLAKGSQLPVTLVRALFQLVDVVAAHGGRSAEAAQAYLAALKKAGRYQADVY
ncbi:MAG: hypothetical protein ACOVOI_18040, partial [Hyphomicrobiales bacterium]